MRYASAPLFRQALEARLGATSRAGGPSLARLRKEVVFDRLLARLVAVAPDHWILKGALALDYRFGDRARTTRDIDLAAAGNEASVTADLLAAQARDSPSLTQRSLSFLMVNATPREPPVPLELVRSA